MDKGKYRMWAVLDKSVPVCGGKRGKYNPGDTPRWGRKELVDCSTPGKMSTSVS